MASTAIAMRISAVFAPHVKVWHFGHDHTDHGVWTLAENGAKFINVGAVARGVLDYDTLTRQVKVAITRHGRRGPPAGAADCPEAEAGRGEVFDLPLREKKRQEQAEIDAFVAELTGNLSRLMTVDYLALLESLGLRISCGGRWTATLPEPKSP